MIIRLVGWRSAPAEARRFPEWNDRRSLRRAGKIETKTGSPSIAKAHPLGQACQRHYGNFDRISFGTAGTDYDSTVLASHTGTSRLIEAE
jgi:hypothetical protein